MKQFTALLSLVFRDSSRDGAQTIEFQLHEMKKKKHGTRAAERSVLNQGDIQI